MKMQIKIGNFDRVKEFVELVRYFDSDLFLKHGRYVIDAQSIMGILSISFDKVLELEIIEKSAGEKDKLHLLMKEHGFLVD
ncbi:MAG: HPr family phosphocarrier protein [Lachnospiraceae bacterium]|nr:HPr family phosphocarrier protein [Lachnospiraceae bacterium]